MKDLTFGQYYPSDSVVEAGNVQDLLCLFERVYSKLQLLSELSKQISVDHFYFFVHAPQHHHYV